MEVPKKLKDEIWDFCRVNNITDIDGFMVEMLERGFNIEKYGEKPIGDEEAEQKEEKVEEVQETEENNEEVEKIKKQLEEVKKELEEAKKENPPKEEEKKKEDEDDDLYGDENKIIQKRGTYGSNLMDNR